MEKKILGQPLSIWISIIIMIPITFFAIKYRMRIIDDIEIVLMKCFSSQNDMPFTVTYISRSMNLDDLAGKVDSLRTVSPEYAVPVDSMGHVIYCDEKWNNGMYDFYAIDIHIPDLDLYFVCRIRDNLMQTFGYSDGPPTYIENHGCSCNNSFHEFGIVKRRNGDKRQREVIEAIDKIMRKIDPSLKPYEPYVY